MVEDRMSEERAVDRATEVFVSRRNVIRTRISQDLPVDDTKMQVKLALDVLVAATALVGMRNRRPWAFYAVGTFTAAAVVAVAWK
ncbi:hypothetical protein ACFV2C_24515 [[Kitasatospora] papulosa]|uniref:hypothetical protein n=2 Tax=Streptomyces TaxID=1883 RepID=UPI0036A47AC2